MSQPIDPRIANVVYNFLGTTLAQLNEIDKYNLGSNSLKAVKTDPKNVFRVSADASMNILPSQPVETAPPPVVPQPQATVVAAPDHNVVNAGLNLNTPILVPATETKIHLQVKNSSQIKVEFDKIISALTNIKNLLDEPIHN